MISAAELAIGIRQTEWFIAADPETITVTPAAARVSDGAGGHTTPAGAPYSETVRLIPQSDRVPVIGTWEGTRERVDYVLLGVPSQASRLAKGSVFSWRGQSWKLSQIHDKPDYEFKADVVLNGG